MKAEERNGTTSKSQKLLSPFHKRITHSYTTPLGERRLLSPVSRFHASETLGETVKLEKTCCIHIKHVGISILHAGDTSEPCFYKTFVECLDKTNIYTKLVFAENIKAF
mgnify:CR=1 FL=1